MHLEYHGLRESPFSITPDPRFVYLSERHRDALAHLLFGIDKGGGGGFVQLTGEVGTGKTTLSRLLLEQLPEDARVALVLNPRVSAVELLETICEELHIPLDGTDGRSLRGSAKQLVDALNRYLLEAYAQGLRVVLVIDEAQNLSPDALEQVRLLTNLETDTQKLLQVILLGQPELRAMLARDDLRQLAQRITARYHLTPLDAGETDAYLRHRWRIAGGQRFPFSQVAVQRLHRHAGGVPRLLNVIAERALVAGYARDAASIEPALVDAAAAEVLPPRRRGRDWRLPLAAAAVVAAVALAVFAWRRPEPVSAPDASAAQPVPPPTQPVAAAPARPAVARLDAEAFAQRLALAPATPLPAWRQLLDDWRLPASSITVDPSGPCLPAPGSDALCVQGRAPLDRLLALDRPALLRLHAGSATTWALLRGADPMRARLQIGDDTIDVDRLDLQSHWDGGYATLWRGPAALRSARQGGDDPASAWIRAKLLPAPAPSATGDAQALREAIRRFQAARGLVADGVAGAETLMALGADTPGPRLLRVLED